MWVCTSECRCLWRSKVTDAPGAGCTGSCELLNVGAGNRTWTSLHTLPPKIVCVCLWPVRGYENHIF